MSGMSFISCIRFSLQLIFAEAIFLLPLTRRKNFVVRVTGSVAVYFLLLFGIYYALRSVPREIIVSQIVYYTIAFCMTLAGMAFCFEIEKEQILFAGIGGYTTQHLAYCIVRITLYLFPENIPGVWRHALPYMIVPIVLYLWKIRKYYEEGQFRKKDARMDLLAVAAMAIVIVLSLIVRSENIVPGNDFLQLFLCNVYGLLCCILVLVILFYIPRENKLYHDQQVLEQMIHMMGEQQQLSKENVEIINRKCHDIKHQLNALMSMDNERERQQYVEEIRNAISIYDAIYRTGNAALDTILREKSFLCQEYSVKFSCMAEGEALNFMDTLDIYALFGNALDNAIESVIREEDEEKRIITLQITRKERLVYIHLDNYCKETIEFEDGLPVTSKQDKNYHGFGVKSIRHIAEKYDGEVVLRQQKERFLMDILLPEPF